MRIRRLVAISLIKMRLGQFLNKVVLRWVTAGGVFVVVCLIAGLVPTETWFVFFLTTSILGLTYLPIAWYSLVDKKTRAAMRIV